MLYKAGADINGNPNNCSPLFYAVDRILGKESVQALEYLLTHGAKADVVFKPITNGCNLLSYMIQQSRDYHSLLFSQSSESNAAQQRECLCEAIDLICKYGVKVDHKDNAEMTALDYAKKNGDFIVIERLKKYASH
jgi:ankyrin repeat protein